MLHNLAFAISGAWRVLVVSLVLGAGLPALFALGVRALSYGASGEPALAEAGSAAAAGTTPAARSIGRIAGGTCFAVVLAGVALGITFVVASGLGKTLSFEHVYPTIVAKR